ncbi:MAG: exosortase/archaeosortase family protein [Pirellulaceae bacterium]
MTHNEARTRNSIVLATAVLVLVLVAVYWPSMRMLTTYWDTPDYSHGFLVPFFAGFLLWVRRDMFKLDDRRGSWVGAALILASALFFVAAGVLGIRLIGAFSLLPALAGIVLMVGGWSMFRWAWPAIVFLGFMIPLPVALETMATQPLRRIGTLASTYILQTVGLPAVAEGNVISLSDYEIGVAEACSGLRMLMTSGALAFGLAFLIQRPLWERVIIVLSAVPIALITNILRIAITGLCFEFAGKDLADHVFHNVAGWLMMPMAVGLLWLELAILSRLTIEPQRGPAMVGTLAKQA